MSWKQDTSADGLPIWRGRDSIVNVHREQAFAVYGCGFPAMAVLFSIAATFIVAGTRGDDAVDSLGATLGWLILIAAAPGAYVFWKMDRGGGLSTREFFDEPWTLREIRTAEFHGLAFRREASEQRYAETWRAALSEIARVQVGSTKQWLPSRQLGNVLHQVTPYENQTFLFMEDGSRRMICSINGDLETLGTLAHSVRVWLEARKTEALLARQAAEMSPAQERQEGFQV